MQLQEREVDFAAIVDTDEGQRFILHLEFQVKDDPDMLLRVAEYHGIWQRRYDLPIRHYVLFLGKRPPRMVTRLPENMVFAGFEIINLHDIDPATMLASDIPEEVMLAILGKFDPAESLVVIRRTLLRLRELSANPKAFQNIECRMLNVEY